MYLSILSPQLLAFTAPPEVPTAVALFPELRQELFSKLDDFGGNHSPAVRLVGIVLIIALVIVLRPVKDLKCSDLGNNAGIPDVGGIELGNHLIGNCLLLGGVVEDRGAILSSDVGALSVECCRVVDREEDLQEFLESYHLRIKSDLNYFSMPSGTAANLSIAGVGGFAARIAGFHLLHALQLVENRLQAPKTPAGQCGDLSARRGTYRFRLDLVHAFLPGHKCSDRNESQQQERQTYNEDVPWFADSDHHTYQV